MSLEAVSSAVAIKVEPAGSGGAGMWNHACHNFKLFLSTFLSQIIVACSVDDMSLL